MTVHEALELHEIMSFKTNCAAKAQVWLGIVSDPNLKKLIQQDCNTGKKHISELKLLLQDQSF